MNEETSARVTDLMNIRREVQAEIDQYYMQIQLHRVDVIKGMARIATLEELESNIRKLQC